MGIELNNNSTLYTLHFADDQVVVAQDIEDLEFESYSEWGLTVNMSKTKYLCVGGEAQNLNIDDTSTIASCEEYI